MLPIYVVSILFIICLDSSFGKSITRCKKDTDCDTSYQFCDSVVSACNHCAVVPCLRTLIEEQGDGLCKQICPEYWTTHIANNKREKELKDFVPYDMTATPPEDINYIPVVHSQPETGIQEASPMSSAKKLMILIVFCALLMLFAVASVILWIFKDNIKTCWLYRKVHGQPPSAAMKGQDYFRSNAVMDRNRQNYYNNKAAMGQKGQGHRASKLVMDKDRESYSASEIATVHNSKGSDTSKVAMGQALYVGSPLIT